MYIKDVLSTQAQLIDQNVLLQPQFNDQELHAYMDVAQRSESYDRIVRLIEKMYIPVLQDDQEKSRQARAKTKRIETNLQINDNHVVKTFPTLTNTSPPTMIVDKIQNDEMIHVVEVVADITSRIEDVIFPAKLATTVCTHGVLMQLLQRIIKPPTNEPGTSKEEDA